MRQIHQMTTGSDGVSSGSYIMAIVVSKFFIRVQKERIRV